MFQSTIASSQDASFVLSRFICPYKGGTVHEGRHFSLDNSRVASLLLVSMPGAPSSILEGRCSDLLNKTEQV